MKNRLSILFLFLFSLCHGAVENENSSVTYSPLDGDLDYDISFDFFEETDIKAYLDSTTLELGEDFIVSGNDFILDDSYTSSLTGKTLLIERVLPVTQERSWIDGGFTKLSEIEKAFDKATMLIQQIGDTGDTGKAVRFPAGEEPNTVFLPVVEERKGKYLRFDEEGEIDVSLEDSLYIFKGQWQTATAYSIGDFFYNPSDISVYYYTVSAHTSTSIFADIASGNIILFFDLDEFFEEPESLVSNNYTATTDPTVNDDIDSYSVGSEWINTLTGGAFKCVDNTDGAAVWSPFITDNSYTSEPVGKLAYFPVDNVPAGWLKCNGAAVSKTTYSNLYTYLKNGESVSAYGEDATTFNLPDTRGLFVRVQDNGASVDPNAATRTDRGDGTIGDNTGTRQAYGIQSHTHGGTLTTSVTGNHNHSGTTAYAGEHTHSFDVYYYDGNSGSSTVIDRRTDASSPGTSVFTDYTYPWGSHTHTFTTNTIGNHQHTVTIPNAGSLETRPINIAFIQCINAGLNPGSSEIYTGSGYVSSVGTITSGVWNGSVIESAYLEIDSTDVNVIVYTSSDTWTKPANLDFIKIKAWGAGGGGGGVKIATADEVAAGGGGSGGYSEKIVLESDLSATETVTIGARGIAGSVAGGGGGAGGAVSFGTFCVANGGFGGFGSTDVGFSITLGGNGANLSGAVGDIMLKGAQGGWGLCQSNPVVISGVGGGRGGGSAIKNTSSNGVTGDIGAGGSGAASLTTTGYSGGLGGIGMIVVEEYYK